MSIDDNRYQIRAITRAFDVLAALNRETPSLSLDELQQRVGFNKSSLLRILRTLEMERAIVNRHERYSLGPRVLHLAHEFLYQTSLPSIAERHFPRISKKHGLTASLAVLDGMEVVYLAVENPNLELGLQATIGKRHPAHATAVGKVLLAALPQEILEERLAGRKLEGLTEHTATNAAELAEELDRVRGQGYAIDDEERGIGIRCVAVPIFDAHGSVTASMSLAGPIFHCSRDNIGTYLDTLKETSAKISWELGLEPADDPPIA